MSWDHGHVAGLWLYSEGDVEFERKIDTFNDSYFDWATFCLEILLDDGAL